ncbi:MAG: hypothetical protein H0X12_04060 [Nocardioides sp.]|nr:hypothetical protein [Nocardioides sp.]
MFAHGETVEILTATQVADPYSGSTTDDWSAPTSELVYGVGVEPRPSPEATENARNATVDGYTLYMPADTAITAQNRVIVRGKTYLVDGDAADWRNPYTGWTPGLVVQCKRIEG